MSDKDHAHSAHAGHDHDAHVILSSYGRLVISGRVTGTEIRLPTPTLICLNCRS